LRTRLSFAWCNRPWSDSRPGGISAVMVRPVDVLLAINATSASVPMRHVLPSLANLTTARA
jgi:hypothetical protein